MSFLLPFQDPHYASAKPDALQKEGRNGSFLSAPCVATWILRLLWCCYELTQLSPIDLLHKASLHLPVLGLKADIALPTHASFHVSKTQNPLYRNFLTPSSGKA